MTMLMIYLSALVLGFMIVAVTALAYTIMTYEDDKHDERFGAAKPNSARTKIPLLPFRVARVQRSWYRTAPGVGSIREK